MNDKLFIFSGNITAYSGAFGFIIVATGPFLVWGTDEQDARDILCKHWKCQVSQDAAQTLDVSDLAVTEAISRG